MSNEELVLLIKNREDGSNMLQLWKQMEFFIISLAKKYGNLAELEDLKQEGYLALYDAIDGYAPEYGKSFANYAAYHIQSRMRRYIFHNTGLNIPEWMQNKIIEYEKAVKTLKAQYGQEPERKDLLEFLEMSEEQFEKLLKARELQTVGSLDATAGENEDCAIVDLISSGEDITEQIIESQFLEQLKETLWPLVEELEDVQPKIIKLRFQEQLTLEETGKRLNMEPMKVKCEEAKGIRKLQRPANIYKLRPFLPEQVETTAFYGSVESFKRNWTSSTEKAALKSIEMQKKL